MLGNIGSLRTPQVGPVEKAVDYAFTLVAGWQQPDRGEIGRALNELKAATDHNHAVYERAAQALQQLSHEQAELRELIAEGEQAKLVIGRVERLRTELGALS